MVLCIIVYLLLILFVAAAKKKVLPPLWDTKETRKILMILAAANTLALVLFMTDGGGPLKDPVIARNGYGKGDKTKEMEMTIEGKAKKHPVQIQVQERKYKEQEIKALFEQVISGLDQKILGKNKTKDVVTENLNLMKKYPGTPVEIQWELSRYDVLSQEGKIQEGALSKEGTLVDIKAALHYDGAEALYQTAVKVCQKPKKGLEKIVSEVQKESQEEDELMKEEQILRLPDSWNGLPVVWSEPGEGRGYIMLGLGIFGSFAVVLMRNENRKKAIKEREQQILRDYPEVVSQIVLLLGAGMTMKNVWSRMVIDYRRQISTEGRRCIYEEMECALHEMQGGIAESEAYERFGRRCGIQQCRKLGALLAQNVRKGTKGLCDMLSIEAVQAFEERKSLARKLGEEAGTKLLLPMFMMLVIVMAVIIVPAFLSINI